MKNVVALILGGGRGTRLYPLTKFRAKPAVPLGGKYRLIDIPISNCINSGIKKCYVLTQFLSVSMHAHINQAYRFDRFDNGFVQILAATQTETEGADWFEGTADAVRKNLRYIESRGIDYVLILSGDQLYRMDYCEFLNTHIESGAEATIGGLPVSRQAAKSFGVMRIDGTGRVQGFAEKPQTDAELDAFKIDAEWFASQGMQQGNRELLASMGIYIFNRDFLLDCLNLTNYQDFGKEVFPAAIRSRHVQAHLFDGYWEDIGTIRAFYDANLALTRPNPPFDLHLPQAPVFTRSRSLPPTQVDGAQVSSSIIAEGCRIGKGSIIENSVIGLRSVIGEGVTVRNSIIMGADYYEDDADMTKNRAAEVPDIGLGDGTVIENSIVDKNCRIGRNVRVVNESGVQEHDEESFGIRDGIPVLCKDAFFPDGWRLKTS